MTDFDLAIIGGGINGAGIARDAAGRGLKVILVEQSDLASGTSSVSSKLIHGGLRYLEHGAFSLVRAALNEREVLLRAAPHLIRPLRFILPLGRQSRSAAVVRLGLAIYDLIGRRAILPPTRAVDLIAEEAGQPLKREFHYAYEYSDCFADDARLVIANAIDAGLRGAAIRTRTRCVHAERGDTWRLTLSTHGRRDEVSARVLINAAGPWVEMVAETVLRQPPPGRLRLDKGTHIVVRRLYDHDRAYILQAPDNRIVFAIPFARDFTLVGTTDRNFSGDPAFAAATHDEIDYLCGVINTYFRRGIVAADVLWAFAGVRALYDDGSRRAQDVRRDYVLILDHGSRRAPLLTVYGGKLTTYRRIAEDALSRLSPYFALLPGWTATSPLPGGDFAYDRMPELIARTRRQWPFIGEDHARRLVASYGTRVEAVLQDAKRSDDLGTCFGADLTEAEVRYLMTNEWAKTAEDVLWRRSKLGLRFSAAQRAGLERFMAEARASAAD
jgi:glycerol-3-phosphate dehydrogenase